jgi:hypothetical protein
VSEGQIRVLMWLGIILFASYILAISPVKVVGGVVHGVQQMHDTNARQQP